MVSPKHLLACAVLVVACGGSDKNPEGPVDGPNIACDCSMDPNCKTQDCSETSEAPTATPARAPEICPHESDKAVVQRIQAWVDEVCACTDMDCTVAADDSFKRDQPSLHDPPSRAEPPPACVRDAWGVAFKRATDCKAKLSP